MGKINDSEKNENILRKKKSSLRGKLADVCESERQCKNIVARLRKRNVFLKDRLKDECDEKVKFLGNKYGEKLEFELPENLVRYENCKIFQDHCAMAL